MVKVTLKLEAIFADDVGLTQINYPDVGILGDLVNQFIKKYGNKIRKSFVDSHGNLESHAIILVNGRNHLFLEGLNTILKNGDMIVISPPLIGG